MLASTIRRTTRTALAVYPLARGYVAMFLSVAAAVFYRGSRQDVYDILLQVTVHNRGPEDARVHVLPTLWFRHTWSWAGGIERPGLRGATDPSGHSVVCADKRWAAVLPGLVQGWMLECRIGDNDADDEQYQSADFHEAR